MGESKSIFRVPGYYHWVLVTFFIIIIIIIIIVIIIIILLVYLSIFIAIEFLLTSVNKNFS